MPQVFQVEERPHPWGEKGVRVSLDETAKRAAKGAIRPEVRTWAVEVLDVARKKGEKVHSDWDRARILLKACQAKLWVPDPVFAEYITPARLLACEKHGDNGEICIKGDDCDGLVVLFAAACMSVGLHVMIVGHAYNKAKQIQHVLTAVRVDRKWYYADPSTPEHIPAFPLGRCMDFTRERLLSVPNVQVLCDGAKCLVDFTQYDPDKMNFVTEGIFIGLDGVPQEQHPDPSEFAWRVRWLGDTPSITRKIRWLGQRETAPQPTGPKPVLPPAAIMTDEPASRPYAPPQVVVVKEPADKNESSSSGMSTSDKLLAASVLISALGLTLEFMRRRKSR